jgi:DNA-directed RNA polymerase sigma subunit (sigma70/sigma32)
MKVQLFDSDKEIMRGYFYVLDERERFILTHRFGLDGENPKTLAVVGKMLGYKEGRERVRQLQNIAFSKIRREVMRNYESEENGKEKGCAQASDYRSCIDSDS